MPLTRDYSDGRPRRFSETTTHTSGRKQSDEWVPISLNEALQGDGGPPESSDAETAFRDAADAARAAAARHEFTAAIAVLEHFLASEPDHIGALERLVDVCIAGELEGELVDAQTRLATACMERGCYAEAQVIANDLVLRYPDSERHRTLARHVATIARLSGYDDMPLPSSGIDQHRAIDITPAVDEIAAESDELDIPFAGIRDQIIESIAARADAQFERAASLVAARRFDEGARVLELLIAVAGYRTRAGSRLARIYRERGSAADAMGLLEWIADAPPDSEESGHELAYELALTLEALGLRAEALGVYRELLHEVGPGYRDIAARAKQLAAA
jgi:hypothetical protein